ncbi:MAG: hypothetical protein QOG68_2131 [Solirubrobacteraceae bacterium]|nr:hypothetical protein [Solirubrobacteraceae bacterium]
MARAASGQNGTVTCRLLARGRFRCRTLFRVPPEQSELNRSEWERVDPHTIVGYGLRALRPVEALLFNRYRPELAGRVLEIGVGAGTLTRELAALSDHVTGIDIAPGMVEACRAAVPGADIRLGDLSDLSEFGEHAFDVLVAGYNVIDVLGEAERRTALEGWWRVLAPRGLLIVSVHNLHAAADILAPGRILARRPREVAGNVLHRRNRLRNAARLAPFERHEDGWAILVDEAHDHSLLHYYADRDHQARQLEELGFTLLECLDLDGKPVPPGDSAVRSPELHYVARRSA